MNAVDTDLIKIPSYHIQCTMKASQINKKKMKTGSILWHEKKCTKNMCSASIQVQMKFHLNRSTEINTAHR